MDERTFVERKKEGWERLSTAAGTLARRGPKALTRTQLAAVGDQYRALVSDLEFARSQGASEQLISYLNELAGRAHGVVYSAPPARFSGAVRFVTREFPALLRSNLRYPIAAAAIFLIGSLIGLYLAFSEPALAREMLPYKLAGKSGPKGVPDPALMSSAIMTNNIYVAIRAFAGGMTAGLWTLRELMYNGFVVGALAVFGPALMGPSSFWSLILPHGIIELTAIFICGGAGLMIGSAIIAPGNVRRAEAVKHAAAKALRLFAGTLPFFAIAAIIEGFVSPSVMPTWSKLAFAGLTAAGLALYIGFAGRNTGSQAR